MDAAQRIDRLQKKLTRLVEEEKALYFYNQRLTLFLSTGNRNERADVHIFRGKKLTTIFSKVKQFLMKENNDYEWIKADLAKNYEVKSFEELNEIIKGTRKNYFRSGIAFDAKFECAFIEEELNGNAILTPDRENESLHINLKNLSWYVQKKKNNIPKTVFHPETTCILFETTSIIDDTASLKVIRTNNHIDKVRECSELLDIEVPSAIRNASRYLADQVQANGRFIYGYFSCFNKTIHFYNSLRHASTLYSMIEAYDTFPDASLKASIDRARSYLLNELMITAEETAYVVDWEQNEIKLGANAAAILALVEYMKVFRSTEDEAVCRRLANGITGFQQPDGSFYHVLSYPSLAIKDRFRIVYYEGEATFALLRLYSIIPDKKYLEAAERAFGHFIKNDYWKYHDHWLSYSANELTRYRPDKTYFEFGLKNIAPKLDFIHYRETTYPTFLELMLAGKEMILRMRETEHVSLLTDFPIEWLEQTIQKRMRYQLNGYFYPETAMYMKNPDQILHTFYIRHHSFRVRIDDVEHYLSGYCRAVKMYAGRSQAVHS